MSFNPNDFIKIADDLLKDKNYDHPAGYRTIIGRTYYGCFLHFRDIFGLQSWRPRSGRKKGEIHQVVITTLKSRDRTKGDFLWRLRNKRNAADYNLNWVVNKNDAIYAIQLAKRITI